MDAYVRLIAEEMLLRLQRKDREREREIETVGSQPREGAGGQEINAR